MHKGFYEDRSFIAYFLDETKKTNTNPTSSRPQTNLQDNKMDNYGAVPMDPRKGNPGMGLMDPRPEYPACEAVLNAECVCGFCFPCCQVMNNWKQYEIAR